MNKKEMINLINRHGVKDVEVSFSDLGIGYSVCFMVNLKGGKQVSFSQELGQQRLQAESLCVQTWARGDETDTVYLSEAPKRKTNRAKAFSMEMSGIKSVTPEEAAEIRAQNEREDEARRARRKSRAKKAQQEG